MSDGDERVDELERQVAELEATVRGLTEELVDRTERIRQLESKHELNATPDDDGGEETSERTRTDADEDKGGEAEGEEESGDSKDDIIVA